MSGYEVYPEYGDSVEWIGQIPSDWCRSYLGFECSVKARLGWKGLKADEYVEDGYIFLATPNIKDSEIDFQNVNYITEERFLESPEIMLSEGDVLVTKDGSTTGTTNVVRSLPRAATVNSSIAVLRPSRTVVSEYLYYFFRSEYTQNIIERVRGGMGVPHLFQADLRKFLLLLPPKKQQQKIANFLDHETAKIDTLIEKQQQLIKLLKEKRQAVISHAVTKGLNPDAPMKDSGVEWLGEAPAHWEMTPIKKVCYVNDGNHGEEYPAESDFVDNDEGVPFIRAGDFDNYRIVRNSLRYISREKNSSMRKGNLSENDILFVNRGATIGKLCLITKEYVGSNLNSQIAYLRVNNERFDRNYLLFFLSSDFIQTKILAAIQGGALPQFPIKHILNIDVCHPSIGEQLEISSFLLYQLSINERLVTCAGEVINLLKERRTALISAAVTGKIDVRNWQPPADTSTPSMDA